MPRLPRARRRPGIWNPLPIFEDVQEDGQLKSILPAVSWVTPSQADSDHPPASVHQGQAYVTAVINFNFNQKPRAPVLLPTSPPTDSPSIPGYFKGQGPRVGCTATPPSTSGFAAATAG